MSSARMRQLGRIIQQNQPASFGADKETTPIRQKQELCRQGGAGNVPLCSPIGSQHLLQLIDFTFHSSPFIHVI